MVDSKRVIPLESNPSIFNSLSKKLGLSPILQFHDVYSLTDSELLAFLPQPVYAIILLFPLTKNYEQYRQDSDKGENEYNNEKYGDIKWFKQTIGNGCGLYALLHILANLPDDFIIDNLILNKCLLSQLSKDSSVKETVNLVEQLERNIQLDSNYGTQGQTEAPDASESVDLHFITFVKGKDNHLYELDGRRAGPIDLGVSTKENHILDDLKLTEKIQFYMDNADDENKHNFAMMAIGPSLD
mmetsp:Transcript_591/g.570  ORF Transcript_591/g.570 Transcript_591/m.570 type:complete len:242 (+) Transcript_591:59-784(+)